ncbi:hypothetical protein WR25_21535 [Diploscapter pachys]|uniref:Glycosyltransferase family 92 protein n=1 Tax=Diploscapter pachys TaxID=2018661 RepID=A0A2A2J2I8_9BILA|nr:hypothetical protein WR25_21535 [Diploscapter pachys]
MVNFRGDYWTDPNARVFRHAATAFMHDCMLRARSQAKYVANVDMDDLPFCSGDGNIGERLEEESDKKPRAAQFIAQWILSQQKQDWETVESPKNVRFELSSVRILNRNSIRWDYRVSKKIFHRPDRVIHFDMHRVFKNEQNSEGLEYEAVDISELKIFFLHLRRFERDLITPKLIRFNESFDYSQLIALNHRMTTNYAIRMRNQAFAEKIMTPWAHEARMIMRNLEQCRREAFGTRLTGRNRMCQQSSSGCQGMLTVGDRFHFASMTWLDLTHTALFNSYVES